MNRQKFLQGVKHGVPIGLGYLSVSFAFGIQAVDLGLTPLMAVLISMTNVTSAGQLAGINLMAVHSPLVEMALTQLTINLRYALMSLSLSQKLDDDMNTLRRMIFSFCNTDEIFAVASSHPGRVGHSYLYGLMIVPYVGWASGTLVPSRNLLTASMAWASFTVELFFILMRVLNSYLAPKLKLPTL